MKGKNLEELLNKKIKLTTFNGNEYEGIVIGYVPAQDNEPEIEEISIQNAKDNKTYSIFENEVKNMFQKVIDFSSKIDVLVNNASIALDNDLINKDGREFKSVLDVNLVGTYLVTKYSLDLFDKGAIINVSSTNGIDTGYIESIDYDASKAGVIALTHDFAKVLAPDIRVNAVAPGWINTDMTRELNPDFRSKEEDKILLKRFADPEEIAKVVYFLASDDASYINDTVIRVDGGKSV